MTALHVFAVADGKAVTMRVMVGRKQAAVNAGEFAPVQESDTAVTTNRGAVTDGQLLPKPSAD